MEIIPQLTSPRTKMWMEITPQLTSKKTKKWMTTNVLKDELIKLHPRKYTTGLCGA